MSPDSPFKIGDLVWIILDAADPDSFSAVLPAKLVRLNETGFHVHPQVVGEQPFVTVSQVFATEKDAWLEVIARYSKKSRRHYALYQAYEAATHLIRQQHLESE